MHFIPSERSPLSRSFFHVAFPGHFRQPWLVSVEKNLTCQQLLKIELQYNLNWLPSFFMLSKTTNQRGVVRYIYTLTYSNYNCAIVGAKYNTFPSALRLQTSHGPVSLPSWCKRSRHNNTCSFILQLYMTLHQNLLFSLVAAIPKQFVPVLIFWLLIRFLYYLQWCKVYLASRLQQDFHSKN